MESNFNMKNKMLKKKWKQSTLKEALKFSLPRKMVDSPIAAGQLYPSVMSTNICKEYGGTYIYFDDGSAIYVASSWSGPISEVTPDISADEPTVYIYE